LRSGFLYPLPLTTGLKIVDPKTEDYFEFGNTHYMSVDDCMALNRDVVDGKA